jgi:hypothetical protein
LAKMGFCGMDAALANCAKRAMSIKRRLQLAERTQFRRRGLASVTNWMDRKGRPQFEGSFTSIG